jgi:pimeloyl-[acyl-carrier protein] methyl ester esterase
MLQSTLFPIHGWATNAHIWQDTMQSEKTYYYNARQYPDFNHVSKTLADIYHRQHNPITLIGWSLGGMLSLQLAAAYPDYIHNIVLVSSTAKFTSDASYAAGLSPAIVKRLAKKLTQDKWQTQLEFYQLMFSESERVQATHFTTTLAPQMADIDIQVLQSGLTFLLETDLRPILREITTPCTIIHGTEDTICPVSAAHYLAENLPNGELRLLDGAGHIPFYTRAQDFQAFVKECVLYDL